MLRMNCRTSSSSASYSSTSPSHLNSLGSLHCWLPKNILNPSPRLSSNLNDIMPIQVPNRASLLLTSDKDRGVDSTDSNHSDASSASKSGNLNSVQSYAELQGEILILELKIMHLERYLLSLYRTAMENCIPAISSTPGTDREFTPVPPSKTISCQHCCKMEPHMKSVELVQQAQTYPSRYWSSSDCQNLSPGYKPNSAKNRKNDGSCHRSLADHFGIIHDTHSPDRLSENIMSCICSIYCNLAHSSQNHGDLCASPTSSLSSSSIFSSKNLHWSPKDRDHATIHWLQGSEEGAGKIGSMLEITKISIDDKSFNYAAVMLQNFRSLIRDLEKVDPRKMKREQKLAFWINVHNALVMHAYLAYGIRNRSRNTSILKAAYNVGGQCISAFDIQCSILGIWSYHSTPWVQTLLHSGKKVKSGIVGHPYALEYAEPHVHFALCSGSFSDPVVRVYRAKSIFEDLKRAKEEFVRERVHVQKDGKISMPKMLYNFGKDMSLNVEGVVEMLGECSPSEGLRTVIQKWKPGSPKKKLEWIPYSSSFRYVIHEDLVRLKPTPPCR